MEWERINSLESISLKKFFLVLLLYSCRYNEPFVWTRPSQIQYLDDLDGLQLTSNNPFLSKRICERLIETGIDMDCETNQSKTIGKKMVLVHLESTVKGKSHDFFRNAGISLLTLSFGAIITHSADFEYTIHFPENKSSFDKPNLVFSATGRDGMYAVLPFYLGFASTVVGTGLNTYRTVDSLESYCWKEEVNRKVAILEQDQKTFCKDLEMLHTNALNQVDKKIAKQIFEYMVRQ